MKKFLSILLAVMLMGFTTVTAFAENVNDESKTDETYSSLTDAQNSVLSLVNAYRLHFIYYDMVVPLEVPIWSNYSHDNLENVLNSVEKLVPYCNTIDECIEQKNIIEDAVDILYIDSSELKWMIDYMKKDYESSGYYDADTTAEIKTIYEQAQCDYASGNEKRIHFSYISLRNLLNKLCLKNQVPGDVNNDGKFTIDDVTLMQKNFAGLAQFNSSQNYISGINEHSNIEIATLWQKEIVGILSNSVSENINKQLNLLSTSKIKDPNNKYYEFTPYTEQDNYLYFDDCYYPWWPIY